MFKKFKLPLFIVSTFYILCIIFACSSVIQKDDSVGESSLAVTASSVIYQNGVITSGWSDNSWSSTRNYKATTVVHSPSTKSFSVKFSPGGVFNLLKGSGAIDPSLDTFTFYIYNAGTVATKLNLEAANSNGWAPLTPDLATYCTVPLKTWVQCNVPLSSFGATSILEVGFAEAANKTQGTYYFDVIGFGTSGTSSSSSSSSSTSSSSSSSSGVSSSSSTSSSSTSSSSSSSTSSTSSSSSSSGGSGSDGGVPVMPHLTATQAYASEGTASLLIDHGYQYPYAWTFVPSHCTVGTPCVVAAKVAPGPTQLFLDWSYSRADFDISVYGGATIQNYSVQTSADSTNGTDGTWTTVSTVSGNIYTHRPHLIPFTGQTWVRMVITGSTVDEIDELDLWDASTVNQSFFFHGDSITERCANFRGTAFGWQEQPSFQADVPGYPLQVGGGNVGQGASFAATSIPFVLSAIPDVHVWFFVMGTNDLCDFGGTSIFVTNAQTWINAIKAAGKIPVLVHPIWANNSSSYCYQNGPAFNAAVDALIASNGLLPAVPLYEATVGHPEYFDTNDVHPNVLGCTTWRQTFADYVINHSF